MSASRWFMSSPKFAPRLRLVLHFATISRFALSLWFLAAVSGCWGADFPEPYNSEQDRDAVPMSAIDAAASLDVPTGFKVDLFASEPDVQNPIAMAWDPRGRMWIAENYTYAERSQRFDLNLRDRVIILEDSNGDGKADKRKVFTDEVQMLTSVEVGHGGVWLMCPPNLLFIPDANHDDVPDGPAEVVVQGFEVAKENYHNFANGLRWGPDGWLYGRCGGSCPGKIGLPGWPEEQRVALEGGIWRYHPQRKMLDVLCHGTTNPWGMDWNSKGEAFFVNTVNGHLWQMIPGAHFVRPFTLDPNHRTYELIDMHADHWHFDTGQSWTASRDGAANSLGGGHAHCGAMVYLGDNWPDEYRDRLLTLNFHGRRANQEILERVGSGYIAKHGDDMLLASDPFFRGMDLSYGPDGAVYVIDWSDTGECHDHTGVHRTSGRVFKVSFLDNQTNFSALVDWDKALDSDLLLLHFAKNEWLTRQARIVLTNRKTLGSLDVENLVRELHIAICRCAAEARETEPAREISAEEAESYSLRALSTLHAMSGDEQNFLLHLLDNKNEYIRSTAVKYLTDFWPIDDCYGPRTLSPAQEQAVAQESAALLPALVELAKSETSPLVRLTLASTLQRLPVADRLTLAQALVGHSEDAEDHNLPLLVWYALIPVAESDPIGLAELAIQCKWPKTQRLIARRLSESIEQNGMPIEILVAATIKSDDSAFQTNLMAGIEDGLKGWRKAPQPSNWELLGQKVQTTSDQALQQSIRNLSVVFGDGRAMQELRAIVLDDNAEINLRRSALESMVVNKAESIDDICLSLIGDARLNVVAARGLASANSREIGEKLVQNYRKFRGPDRPQVIALLCSRVTFANALIDALKENKIPLADLTAFDVRQLRSLGDEQLSNQMSELWGDVRDSSAEKIAKIELLKAQLSTEVLAAADKSNGRMLFSKTCMKCHRLFGEGEKIGPELTGANRNNIDYLLENILDPSAVVSKDYRMSIILTGDDRVLNGLIVSSNEKTLTLQTQTELLTLAKEDIEEVKQTQLSPMPDGLMDNLSNDEIRDLFAYLMHPSQVALPE